jgi:hypothetical protein
LVGLFNKKKEKMSWQIPTQIEQDIIAGKATYRTFQTGNGGQSILPVPPNSYAVIFGYDFSPAGGGWYNQFVTTSVNGQNGITVETVRQFETQQISFYTGTDFYPFIHHINCVNTLTPLTWDASVPDDNEMKAYLRVSEIDNSPISRQVYITSSIDVTISVGLIRNSIRVSSNAIPVTSRTPVGLTYGGSPQTMNTQTNYGPAGTPLQFMQPSPKDYQDFAFGLLPSNADGQAFATPDATNGLLDPTVALTALSLQNFAASNYYLNLHYALYNSPIPNTQG